MANKRSKRYTEMRESLKKVVDALMEGEKTYSELLKLGIPEKTLTRVLKDILEFIGLAIKTNGYWAWYTYKKKYNPTMLPLASKHAKQLAPGFEAVLPFHVPTRYTVGDNRVLTEQQINQLKENALAHIKTGYPNINNTLTQFRKLKSKLDKIQTEETTKFVNRLEREGKTHLHIESKNAYLLGPFETEEELRDLMEKHDMTIHGFHRVENGAWFMEGPIYFGKVEVANFLKTREALMQVNQSLSAQIGKLLLQIEWGHPLDGECDSCREIAFATYRQDKPSGYRERNSS